MIFALDIYEWIVNFIFLGIGFSIWAFAIAGSLSLVFYILDKILHSWGINDTKIKAMSFMRKGRR